VILINRQTRAQFLTRVYWNRRESGEAIGRRKTELFQSHPLFEKARFDVRGHVAAGIIYSESNWKFVIKRRRIQVKSIKSKRRAAMHPNHFKSSGSWRLWWLWDIGYSGCKLAVLHSTVEIQARICEQTGLGLHLESRSGWKIWSVPLCAEIWIKVEVTGRFCWRLPSTTLSLRKRNL